MTEPIVYPHPLTAKENARFWDKVEVLEPDDCWEWQAGKNRGYGHFRLRGRNLYAHRVAWEITAGPIPDGLDVCHHCDNPACVNFAHLFLGDAAANMADRDAKGRGARGERMGSSKLTEAEVKKIRRTWRSAQKTYQELAEEYGLHHTAVRDIVLGLSWSHIPLDYDPAEVRSRRGVNRGARNANAKLNPEKVRQLRRRHAAGEKLADLAAEFGVSQTCAWMAIDGSSWKHVE